MIGILYLLLCFGLGWAVCSFAFPGLDRVTGTDCLKRKLKVSPYMVLIPAWFVTGTLLLTWAVYLIAYLFRNMGEPLRYANLIAMPAALLVVVLTVYYRRRRGKGDAFTFLCNDRRTRRTELIFLLAVTALACVLMWLTFFVKEGNLYVGLSVFSDFAPHIGMIRSFSYGNNFPTAYPHYAGEDIKYHFMFQFLAGNLEYLGLRIDFAFNLPSIISFITAFMLLYVLAVKITGKIGAGLLACLFFAFRSSKTLFTYLSQLPEGTGIWNALSGNMEFISSTPNEDWGLWNLNVYCNQRHLAFGLTAAFLVLMLFLPHFYEMFEALAQYRMRHGTDQRKDRSERSRRSGDGSNGGRSGRDRINEDRNGEERNSKKRSDGDKRSKGRINEDRTGGDRSGKVGSSRDRNDRDRKKNPAGMFRMIFLTKEAWEIKDIRLAVSAGLLLGSLAFFHGAAVIGILTVLFVMAIFSRRRLEYLVMALITVLLSELQTHFFIRGSVISPQLLFGFIAENKTLFGAASYLDRLLGILPWVLLAAFCLGRGTSKYLMLAFTAPLLFAFTVSLTVDVTVNHKYIMMSCILLGIFAAGLITQLLERKDLWTRVTAVVLSILMTATGIYDFTTVLKKNTPDNAIVLDLDDPLTMWIKDHSTSRDIFLTPNYSINQAVLAGAMLYEGWPYYPWSAGYDTNYRTAEVKKMYEAATPAELDGLTKEHHIRFIIVDNACRTSTDYAVNEENISSTYERVYSAGEGEWNTSIYDVQKPLPAILK